MKRAVLKRFTAFIASLLVVTILSPNFVYSVKASAHEGEANIAVETSETEETEAEKAKAPKTESEKKTVKETKQVKETEAEPEEAKAKETEGKETEAKAEETKAAKVKESEKEAPAETAATETEQVKETSAEPKETVPSETSEETKSSEPERTSESSEPAETSEETQPSESEPSESSETAESSEETEPSDTTETTAAETAPAAKIKVAESAEEFIKSVASLPESYRLIIDTDKDLSSLKGAKGVYYDGSYVLVFDSIDNYDAALKYLSSKKISFSIDGSVELCGIRNLCNNVTVNPKAKTKIAIIDTGSSLANEKVSVMGDKGEDKNGHGTAMASRVLEQSDDAYIISIKAIGDDGNGKVADVYAALQYAIDADCKVILMAISLRDLGQYEAFKNLVADAVAKGITVVASAGNNGTDASKYIPAGLKDVLTAGAMDENGVKLPKSNYGKSVEYYVVADSTSEAAAVLAGKVIAGKTDELATNCKMSASEGKDNTDNKFKINAEKDLGDVFNPAKDGKTLFELVSGFCVFADYFKQSNHMEGTVAAGTLDRNTNEVMDLNNPNIYNVAKKANFYYYCNNVINTKNDAFGKELLGQPGPEYAPLYLGSNLVYATAEKNADNTGYHITVGTTVIPIPDELANNGSKEFLVSKSDGNAIVVACNYNKNDENPKHEITKGGDIGISTTNINFNKVLQKIGKWSKDLYDKKDLDLNNYTPVSNKYTIKLHDGINYINITETQLNSNDFDFQPSSENSSVVINVINSGNDTAINWDTTERRVTFDSESSPERSVKSLKAASRIMFNFHPDITAVNIGNPKQDVTVGQLGTLLAPGATLTLMSTHDGNAIAKKFENINREIHQSGFVGFDTGDVTYNQLTVKKNYFYTGTSTAAPHGSSTAKFKLTGTGNVADYSSEQSSGYVWKNLRVGTYTLTETGVPSGFTGMQPLTVKVGTDWKITVTDPNSQTSVTLPSAADEKVTVTVNNYKDKPDTFTVNISKVDAANSKELKDAVLTITNADGNTFDFSKVTAKQNGADAKDLKVTSASVSFTSVEDYKTVVSGLEAGQYVLTETTAPGGYEKAEAITFTVGTDGKVSYGSVTGSDTVVMEDKATTPTPTTVTFSKKEMTGTGSGELTGATMKLSTTDSNIDFSKLTKTGGSNVTVSGDKKSVTWETASEQFKVDLPDGTYTLEETIAPDGYNVITTTIFTVKDGAVTKTTSNTDVEISGTVITAFDEAKKTYEVSISKQEMNGQSDELNGASMKLTASNDTSVNWTNARKSGPAITVNGKSITWTSSQTDGALVVNLPDGEYTLEETATLKIGDTEYTKFTTSTFTMKDGKVTESASTASDKTVTFTGTDGRTVTAYNTPKTTPVTTYKVSISKQEMNGQGKELKGAKMQLTAGAGTDIDWTAAHVSGPALAGNGQVAKWESGDEPLVLNLPDGEYTLEETATLKIGETEYTAFTTSTFTMKDGKVTESASTASDKTVTFTGTDGRTVTAYNTPKTAPGPAPTTVTFSKKEMTGTGTGELTGATMKLSTTDSNIDFSKLTKTGGSNVTVSDDKKSVTWETASEQFKVDLPTEHILWKKPLHLMATT